jgi:pyridoxal 5'-phosphate synthase pdxS subunit
MRGIRELQHTRPDELFAAAKELRAPYEVVNQTAELGELPVPNFAAGGIATPADASLMRQLGAQAVFVGSGIFKSSDPERVARAIVKATTHYDDPALVAEVSAGLGEPMRGLELSEIPVEERLAVRGW